MEIQPLSKDIYQKAKEKGIEQIELHFSGGNDEGYLNVFTLPHLSNNCDFLNEIEDWAWSVYDYSGAGAGNDYGDNIVYDLKNNVVNVSEWYYERKDTKLPNQSLVVEGE